MEEHDSTFKSAKIIFDDSETGNRKVVVKEPIAAGELLIREPWFLFGIRPEFYKTSCHQCLQENKQMLRCSGCKYTHYCNPDHQMKDWKRGHKKECAIVKKLIETMGIEPNAEVMIMIKTFVQTEVLEDKEFTKVIKSFILHPENTSKVDETRSSIEIVIENSSTPKSEALITRQSNYFRGFMANIMTINSNQVDGKQGLGLLDLTCWVNHSCEPNAFTSHIINHGMRIVSARAINPGEEITISYVDPIQNRLRRRKNLKHGYYFDCNCVRCVREANIPVENTENMKISPELVQFSLMKLRTGNQVEKFIKDLDTKLNEYDYEWATVIDNVEYVLVQLGELQVLYNLRLKFTKKFEYWYRNNLHNSIVGERFVILGHTAGELKRPDLMIQHMKRAIQLLKGIRTEAEMASFQMMVQFAQMMGGGMSGKK